MDFFWNIVVFIFGAIVGSFLNCVIYRLEQEEEFIKKRSYCPNCKNSLEWRDLIPVLSFLALSGKCRNCKARISWQYPIVEILTGLMFLLTYNYQLPVTNFINLIYYFYIAAALIIIFVFDLKHFIIPDKVLFPAIFLTLIFRFLEALLLGDFSLMLNVWLAAIMASGFFLFIIIASRGAWMGMGDAKLAILMGLFVGYPNILVALFSAFCLGAIIGVGLMAFKKYGLKSEIPFGPFLITGLFIALFLGKKIVNWYVGMLLN